MDASVASRAQPSAFLERRIGAETVVYDQATHRAHALGPIASAVWRSWEAGVSASELARRVAAEVGEPVGAVAIALALRRLERARLVARAPRRDAPRPDQAAVPGRREALRRVATLAGLTVVSLTIPAPEAVACSVQLGQQCQTSSQCCPTSGGSPTCCGQILRRCIPTRIANCGP